MVSASDILFNHGTSVAPLGLIAMKGAEELGKKLNEYLVNWAHKGGYDVDTFLIESECPRFSSGDGKGLIKSTVRGKDLFIIIDVGNYNVKYQMYDQQNAMSPDDSSVRSNDVLCAIRSKSSYFFFAGSRSFLPPANWISSFGIRISPSQIVSSNKSSKNEIPSATCLKTRFINLSLTTSHTVFLSAISFFFFNVLKSIYISSLFSDIYRYALYTLYHCIIDILYFTGEFT